MHTVFDQYGITVDETGSSLTHLDGPPLEEVAGSADERELEVGRRIERIEGVHGGEGGEVGVFDINHLGGHRYAGVMLVSPLFWHSTGLVVFCRTAALGKPAMGCCP